MSKSFATSSRIPYTVLQQQSEDFPNWQKKPNNSGKNLEDEVELRSRNKYGARKSSSSEDDGSPNCNYFEKTIQNGDTLQKLALQYSVQVSELKRANNLLTDQDFYALKIIRIPMTKFSTISETKLLNCTDEEESGKNEQNQASVSSKTAADVLLKDISQNLPDDFQLTGKLISISDDEELRPPSPAETPGAVFEEISTSNNDNQSSQNNHVQHILHKVDASLEMAREKNNQMDQSQRDSTDNSFHFYAAGEPGPKSWWYTSYSAIIFFLFLLFIVIPLFIVYEKGVFDIKVPVPVGNVTTNHSSLATNHSSI